MILISKFNNRIRFLLCAINFFSKNAWVILLKDEKGITITNAFQKHLKESDRKPNKMLVDKGSEFYNRSVKSFLQNNNTEIYSIHNEGKSVVAERFVRTLKNKIYKCLTSKSKNVYIDKLDDIVNKYSNTRMYIDFNKKIIRKVLNLKLVTMLEYQNIKTFLQTVTFQIDLKKFL